MIAVEVGAPQLPFLHSMSPHSTVCLNIAEDHVDLFGSFEDYVAAKAKAYERTRVAAIYNVADEVTLRMVRGGRRRRGVPGDRLHPRALRDGPMLGVVEDLLVDRAFVADRAHAAPRSWPRSSDVHPPAPHKVANALAAAALARALGRPPRRRPRRAARPSARPAHRIAAGGDGRRRARTWTTPRRPTATPRQTSLLAYEPVVWIAGGMAKGQ